MISLLVLYCLPYIPAIGYIQSWLNWNIELLWDKIKRLWSLNLTINIKLISFRRSNSKNNFLADVMLKFSNSQKSA